jgi:hypothetical protein
LRGMSMGLILGIHFRDLAWFWNKNMDGGSVAGIETETVAGR